MTKFCACKCPNFETERATCNVDVAYYDSNTCSCQCNEPPTCDPAIHTGRYTYDCDCECKVVPHECPPNQAWIRDKCKCETCLKCAHLAQPPQPATAVAY